MGDSKSKDSELNGSKCTRI